MRKAVVFEADRSGYGIDQIADKAITVGELKAFLEDYDDDTLVVLSHDRGYTFGSISEFDCREATEDEDGEWEDYAEERW